ncbi:MAG: DUF1778 domain-containing protein [Nocardiopsaceae bacterium]|nr:DUF1778 domain-containing protein [Nocardiopsaceae bacterium]
MKLTLSDEEHALLSSAAEAEGMTLGAFSAYAAMGVARGVLDRTPDLRESMVRLNEFAVALNEVGVRLRSMTSGEAGNGSAPAAMEALVRLMDEVEETLDVVRRSAER